MSTYLIHDYRLNINYRGGAGEAFKVAYLKLSLHRTEFLTLRYMLRFVQEIPFHGIAGRLDHLSYDQKGNRIFLSCLSGDTVQVIDMFGGLPSALIDAVALSRSAIAILRYSSQMQKAEL